MTKRQPKGPRTEGFFVAGDKLESITAIPYDILKVRWLSCWERRASPVVSMGVRTSTATLKHVLLLMAAGGCALRWRGALRACNSTLGPASGCTGWEGRGGEGRAAVGAHVDLSLMAAGKASGDSSCMWARM